MAEKSSELKIFGNSDETVNEKPNEQLTRIDEDQNQILEIGERADAPGAKDETDETADETEAIRGQIIETRREMSKTIDQIQDRLSVANITEQVKEQVSEQIGGAVETVKQTVSQKAEDFANVVNKGMRKINKSAVVKTTRENPWILSVIGLGIGALVANSLAGKKKKRAKNRQDESYDLGKINVMSYHADDNYAPDYKNDFDADEVRFAGDKRSDLKSGEAEINEPQETRGRIAETANSAYESVSSAAGTAYESVGKAAGKTYKGASNAAGFAYDKAGDLGGHVKTNYDYYIEENPLVVGAAALAIGAAVGMAIPLTKAENGYFGEMRDNAVDKIQTTAQEAIDTAKQVVGEAQKAFTDDVIAKMK